MNYETKKKSQFIIFIIITVSAIIWIFILNFCLSFFRKNWYFEYEALHSALEIFGVISALLIAMVLLQREKEDKGWEFFFLVLGFLTMGILNGFHAIAQTENKFIFLHSAASLLSGFLFCLVWIPHSFLERYNSKKRMILWVTVSLSLLFGAYILLFPERFPAMIYYGEFTSLAISLHYCAFIFFLFAGGRFALTYLRSGNLESYLFIYLIIFLGLSNLSFSLSSLWNLEWWTWQLLRLGAFLLALGFVIRGYLDTITQRNEALEHCKCAEKALREKEEKFRIIMEDIREEKEKLHAELQQTHKIEALGTLTGGIAHEFNNILSIIIGHVELAATKISQKSPIHYTLDHIFEACLRARDIVKQILIFSRHRMEKKEPLQMSLVVKEALKLIRASLPSTIKIRRHIDSCASLMADYTQIQQILMNLCNNAAHAMREQGGVIDVNLIDIHIDSKASARDKNLKQGRYIRLTVSDTGHGMDPRIIDRIFDPYFTTKEVGSGTGMGLTVVHGIVKKHGGEITVHSTIGEGTTFQLFFPTIECEVSQKIIAPLPLPRGKERILFVEDEKELVDTGKQMLKNLGYEIIARTSSAEAIETFRCEPNKFDLVITDQTMPSMTGDMLAKELIAIRPDIPIILCTGFSETFTDEEAKAVGIREYFMKPIIKSEIALTIRNILDTDLTI
jgi:signal transduction histidine kinase